MDTPSKDNIINRINAMLRLATDPASTPGEKRNAFQLITKLKNLYDVSEKDIESAKKEWRKFTYKNKHEYTLLTQIVGNVLGVSSVNFKRHKTITWFDLTKQEYDEIEFLYRIYRHHLNSELEVATIAFIHANKIFGPGKVKDAEEELSKSYIEKALKISRMASTMDAVKISRMLIEASNE